MYHVFEAIITGQTTFILVPPEYLSVKIQNFYYKGERMLRLICPVEAYPFS